MDLDVISIGRVIQRLSIIFVDNPNIHSQISLFLDRVSDEDFTRFLDADWLRDLLKSLITNLQSKKTELLDYTWPLLSRLATKVR